MAFEEAEWVVYSVSLNWKKREKIKYHHRKSGPQPVCFVKKKNGGLKVINQTIAP